MSVATLSPHPYRRELLNWVLRYTGDFFAADGGGTALQPFLTGEAFGFVRFCLAWQIAEGLSPTRRRVPPQLIQSTGVPIVPEQWGKTTADNAVPSAASAAVPNAPIHSGREYQITRGPHSA